MPPRAAEPEVTRASAARCFSALAALALAVPWMSAPAAAHAEPRFGDSTWVAPGYPADSDSGSAGPRVAAREHERVWESAIRLPFRVVSFPLRLTADALDGAAAYVGPRYLEPKPRTTPKRGPVISPDISLGGLNDIGIGPAVRWSGFPTPGTSFALAGTWSAIDRRRIHADETVAEGRPVSVRLDYDYDHKPNHRFYGIGDVAPRGDLSYYLLSTLETGAEVMLGASPLRQARFGARYASATTDRAYHAGPDLLTVFAPGDAPGARGATREVILGAGGEFARLDDPRDPSRGFHGRLDLEDALGMRAADPDYRSWRAEARGYVPVGTNRRVMVVRLQYRGVEPGSRSVVLPFYRLPSSDGDARFAGYSAERFRDRQLALARAEYRWSILFRLNALAFYELGEVAPRFAEFTRGGAHGAFGMGLRMGMSARSAVRTEIAKSREGVHATFALGSDF